MSHHLKQVSLATAARKVKSAERKYVQQDPLKHGIEPYVRRLVVALTAHGFPVTGSCEGHLGQNLYPYIIFCHKTRGQTKEALLRCINDTRFEIAVLERLTHEFYRFASGRSEMGEITHDRFFKVNPPWDPWQREEEITSGMTHRGASHVSLIYSLKCIGADALSHLPREILKPHEKEILTRRQQDAICFARFLVSRL